MKYIATFTAILIIGSSAFGQVNLSPDRKVVSSPNIEFPPAAVETGLRGAVLVEVEIDRSGNVVKIGDVEGPASICPSITTPDVVALREAAKTIAQATKFEPLADKKGPKKQEMVIKIHFHGSKTTNLNRKEKLATKTDSSGRTPEQVNFSVTSGDRETETPAEREENDKAARAGGLLNGKATHLPRPLYSNAARSIRASGPVMVRVLVEETGTVYSAMAVSGHPLLRKESRSAACKAKFRPTMLDGKPIRSQGYLTYIFAF